MRKSRNGLKTENVTLTDTGPLVALVDRDDRHHAQATETLRGLPKVPLLTTWPCLTEAMYLLHQSIGYTAQEALWRFIEKSVLHLYLPSENDWRRMRELMAVFQDAPMDMADASIVVAAEQLSLRRVFTYDRHFYAYRLANGDALEVVQ
jgi:predicted nucleic acid-binding protein